MSDPNEDDDDPTVVIDREPTLTGDALDKTISLGRRPAAPSAKSEDDPVLRLLPTPLTRIVIPAGPGVVESYAPREALPPPVRASTDAPAASRTRADAATLPSAAKLSRRAGLTDLVSAAAAGVVSVVGIVAIVVWFLGH